MAVLHVCFAGGEGAGQSFVRCLEAVRPGDSLLLADFKRNRVASECSETARTLAVLANECKIYVLNSSIDDPDGYGFELVDHAGFVDLACRHHPIVTWS